MSSPSLWQELAPRPSRPRLEGTITREVCVVGAGISGGSCAWRLLEQGLGVTLLEGRTAAASASGRNGGMGVSGLGLEAAELAERVGAEQAAALLRATAATLDTMVERAAELGVADAVRRTGSLRLGLAAERASLEAELDATRAAGLPCEWAGEWVPAGLAERFPDAIRFPDHAALQPARWVRALVDGAVVRGAELYESSPVVGLTQEGDGWLVRTPQGTVAAQAVVIACDGLIPRLAPVGGAIYPARGQVVATARVERPVLPCPTGALHGFVYGQQTAAGEVVLGGFRHLDLESEYTDVEEITPVVQAGLESFLGELDLGQVEITHRWAGIMGFSVDLLPLAGELPGSPGLFVCGGYSGAGNVLGHLCGGLVADLIATGTHPHTAAFDPARFSVGIPEPTEKASSREFSALLAG